MHESAIAQSIIDVALRHLEEGGWRRVTRITVRVGHLSSVVPESLDFAFQAMIRGTPLEGSVLDIEETPGEGRCRACGAVFPVDSFFCICEKCGSGEVEVQGGDVLTIESIDMEQ